ncbi:hypothetical protein T492DRAFT_127601 [Pavlovales sp. CCMP2436]|nr:hypothetical protein T492DRAFT_127601 [Pavlovales sp. CCMP2436]
MRCFYVYKHQEDLEPAFFCPLDYHAVSQYAATGPLSKKLEIRVADSATATPRISRARSGGNGSGPEAGRTMVFEASDEQSAKDWLRAIQQFTLQEGMLVVPQDEFEAWEAQQLPDSNDPPSLPPSPRHPPAPPPRNRTPQPSVVPAGPADAAEQDADGAASGSSLRERRALAKAQQLSQRQQGLAPVQPAAGGETKARIEKYYEALDAGQARADSGALAMPATEFQRKASGVADAFETGLLRGGEAEAGAARGAKEEAGAARGAKEEAARAGAAPVQRLGSTVAPLGVGLSAHTSASDSSPPNGRFAAADAAEHADDSSSSAAQSPRQRNGGTSTPRALAGELDGGARPGGPGSPSIAQAAAAGSADEQSVVPGEADSAQSEHFRCRCFELRLLDEEVPLAALATAQRERALAAMADSAQAARSSELSAAIGSKQQQLAKLERALQLLDAAVTERTAALRAVSARVSAERGDLSSMRFLKLAAQPTTPGSLDGGDVQPGAAAAAAASAAAASVAASAGHARPGGARTRGSPELQPSLSCSRNGSAHEASGSPARVSRTLSALNEPRPSPAARASSGAPDGHAAHSAAGLRAARAARAAAAADRPSEFADAAHPPRTSQPPLPGVGVDAALLVKAGAAAGLPARLARLVCAGAHFLLLSETRPGHELAQPAERGEPTLFWVSSALDLLHWTSTDDGGAEQRTPAPDGRASASTPTALIQTIERGGWHGTPGSAGSTADPYSAKNCAWQFRTETHTVRLLAQDNAQREDWVTALTLISKAAARGMLPGARGPGGGLAQRL